MAKRAFWKKLDTVFEMSDLIVKSPKFAYTI